MLGYTLRYKPNRWEEGVLCGNGTLGAIAMAQPVSEQVIFSHERVYSPIYDGSGPPLLRTELSHVRGLIANGKYKEAVNVPLELMERQYKVDRTLWTNPFMPACNLIIELQKFGSVADYARSLDFSTGLGQVSYTLDGVAHKREFFISRPDRVMVMRLSADEPSDYYLTITKHPEDNRFYSFNGHYPKGDLAKPIITTRDNNIFYHVDYEKRDAFYQARVCIGSTNGFPEPEPPWAQVAPRHILLRQSTETVLLFSLVTQDETDNLDEIANLSFDELLRRHTKTHQEMFERTILRVQANEEQSDDERLWHETRISEKTPAAFFNKIYAAGQYAILSAAGETPPNLQGIWTGVYGVPWSSDYTNNGNLQTAILSMLPTGLFECAQSLFTYLENFMEDFRFNAQQLYGCRGIHIPSRTSDVGFDYHFGAGYPMLFWTAGAAWFAHFYFDYWLYTGDNDFFVNRALPFMKEAALFYEDFLVPDENGKWLFTPSYSPENTPANSDAAACENAVMDIAVSTELFTNLIIGCRTLGIEQESIAGWQNMLDKMPPYLVTDDGILKEWATPKLLDNFDHRHSSHLYMLYYDLPKEFRKNKALLDAAGRAYEIRMEKRQKEKGVMAFGLVQCGMTAAHLGDAQMVGTLLTSMARNNYYPTFASSHDAGPKIFNTDISGGIPALMLESIAQSTPVTDDDNRIVSYEITLLPATPDCMKSGQVAGMRLRGGYALDMTWQDNDVTGYRIDGAGEYPYTIINKGVGNR